MKRILEPSDYRTVPWKNGGGTTLELFVEGAGERFVARASIADVRSSGPFSKFDGYDRHIVVIEGRGMTLRCEGREDLALVPLVPSTFDGDADVHGELRAGAVRDFNWIVDRRRARGSLEVRRIEAGRLREPPTRLTLVHVLEGTLGALHAGRTLVTDEAIEIEAAGLLAMVASLKDP